MRSESAELYHKLLLPIEPWIANHRRLVFEPDGILGRLPWGALVDEHGAYLGDRFAIAVSPGMEYSFRKWSGISRASSAYVLGDPTVQGRSSLPAAGIEARTVAASFARSRLSVRGEVTQREIIREISKVDVFHFAGHAESNKSSTGLVVGARGLFDAWEIGHIGRQRSQLVVLSACSSAIGGDGDFFDQDSLVERFIASGVPAVVASRWNIDSTATAALMQKFYGRLISGGYPSDAFSRAAKEIRADLRFAHPYFWAGFTVFGES